MLRFWHLHGWWVPGIVISLPVFFLPALPDPMIRGVAILDEISLLLACAALYVALSKNRWSWNAIGLACTVVLIALPLLRAWQRVESGANFVLGFLPIIDAGGYYSDTLRLGMGKMLESEAVYRPLFSGFLAALLGLFNGNLQLALVVLSLLYGLGLFSLMPELSRSFGPLVAVAVFVLFQFFSRQIAGTVMTEQLGSVLGMLGLAALLRAARNGSLPLYGAGILLVSFALFVRAGAYFVLAALIVWGLLYFSEKWRPALLAAGVLAAAVFTAWALDTAVRATFSPPGTVPSTNFAYTLYGQASGGQGWEQIFIDHPELSDMPFADRGHPAYAYAFEVMRQHPAGILIGTARALRNYCRPGYLFGMVEVGNETLNIALRLIALACFLAGVWVCWRKRIDPQHGTLLAAFVGSLLSVPLLPPWDAGLWFGGIRVHAATLGIHLILTGIGFSELVQWAWPRFAFSPAGPPEHYRSLSWILGLAMAMIAVIGPYVVSARAPRFDPEPLTCAPNQVMAAFRLSDGAYIKIESDDSGLTTRIPVVLLKDMRRSMKDYAYSDLPFIRKEIARRSILLVTNDLITGRRTWIIARPALEALAGRQIVACGNVVEPVRNVIEVTEFRSN